MKILIMGYVWPEPESSAAGLRTYNLVEIFTRNGWKVFFSSGSSINGFTQKLHNEYPGLGVFHFEPNDSGVDLKLRELNPDVVIFDRFVVEEQFGWRVKEACPQALCVIDTQDLHFLRRAREVALKKGADLEAIVQAGKFTGTPISEDGLRELGSILRSDLSLLVSDYEFELLKGEYHVPERLLLVSRFHYPVKNGFVDFEQRRDFVMIGNFRHAPNWDGVRWFKEEIWPKIHEKLPEARVRIYGSYPPREAMALTQPKQGFFVEGPVSDQFEVLSRARVNLAPLRFGAGIKGKISDGWWVGTPVVTTPIGSEGMCGDLPFGGMVASTPETFAEHAVRLYQDPLLWQSYQKYGSQILTDFYSFEQSAQNLLQKVTHLLENRDLLRRKNIIGSILNSQFYRSTKYFSKWIEEKNRV